VTTRLAGEPPETASRRRREWLKAYSGERKRLRFGCITDSFAVRCCLPAEQAEASFPGAFFVSFLCRHKEMKMKEDRFFTF
jgi:hypothetical protein